MDTNSKDPPDRTPLSLTAENGRLAVVQVLLRHNGVDINLTNRIGRMPLSWAAENGRKSVVGALLDCDDPGS